MSNVKVVLALLLQAVTAIVKSVQARRADDVRKRASTDGGGLLLDQLNPDRDKPDSADPARAQEPATADAGRDAGRLDG